jgi:hypothetical protein
VDHVKQGPENTLTPLDFRTEDVFWSSTGSADPNSSEHLIYELQQSICAVFDIGILPYKAGFQQGEPIYGPQRIQVSIGFSPTSFHWMSDIIPVDNTHGAHVTICKLVYLRRTSSYPYCPQFGDWIVCKDRSIWTQFYTTTRWSLLHVRVWSRCTYAWTAF